MNSVRDEWKMECPRCHSDEAIQIEILVWCDLCPDGTDIEAQDHEWDNDNKAKCGCGFEGNVSDFLALSQEQLNNRQNDLLRKLDEFAGLAKTKREYEDRVGLLHQIVRDLNKEAK